VFKRPVILTTALTGNMTMPSQTPYLPITSAQLIEDAVGCWEAGAAVVHIHMRKPETGEPCGDVDLWGKVLGDIKERCDVVVCTSTGGGPGMSVAQRAAVVSAYRPELASFNLGSMNFGMFAAIPSIKEWKYAWEKPYLENTKDFVFKNTFADLDLMCRTMKEYGTKPELEVYDVGHLYSAAYMIRQGWLEFPIHIQFVMGVLGGIGTDIRDLIHLLDTAQRLFEKNFTWSVIGIGYPAEFALGTTAALLGGNVRVGLEDNIKIKKGELAKGNRELALKMAGILKGLDFELASPAQARKYLGLKGLDNVNY